MPGGAAARSFSAASAGTAADHADADRTAGRPRPSVSASGIPQSDGAGCYLTQTVQAGASSAPQLTVPVEAGTYCVRLYDPGALTSPVAFSVTIVRP